MKPIDRSEVLTIEEYARVRDDFRGRVLPIKADRRVLVGDYLCFLFENRDTMLYQVQEMLRVEGIRDEKSIAHEIETYNELVPARGELAATLLIEIPDEMVRRVKLRELVGLEDHVHLIFQGDTMVSGRFDERQIDPEKISSVQYIRFPMGAERARDFLQAASVEILTDHPACSYRKSLRPEQLAALKQDLAATLG